MLPALPVLPRLLPITTIRISSLSCVSPRCRGQVPLPLVASVSPSPKSYCSLVPSSGKGRADLGVTGQKGDKTSPSSSSRTPRCRAPGTARCRLAGDLAETSPPASPWSRFSPGSKHRLPPPHPAPARAASAGVPPPFHIYFFPPHANFWRVLTSSNEGFICRACLFTSRARLSDRGANKADICHEGLDCVLVNTLFPLNK